MFKLVDSASISINTVPTATKRMKFKENRPGLFDDMVFYMHDFRRNYLGEGWREVQIRQDILTNGGQIVSSPTDPTVTHILVPPDKEARGRDHGHSSILNLKEILNESYNTKTKEEVKIWDIPALVLFFGEHLSENMEVIKQAEKPILRFWWVGRCVRARKVLGQEEGDWGGQYIRARIFPDISRYIPDNRPIQAIDMSGQGVSKAHLDFARNMSSGGNSSARQSTNVTSAYQPKSGMDGRTQSDFDIRDDAIAPKSWTRNIPTGPRAGSSSSDHNPGNNSAVPKRCNALAGSLKSNMSYDIASNTDIGETQSEPLTLVSLSSEEQNPAEPFEAGRLVIRDESPPKRDAETSIPMTLPMTPISSTDSVPQSKKRAVVDKKRDHNTHKVESLPPDPRPSAKRRKTQTSILERPIEPITQETGGTSTQPLQSNTEVLTSPAVPAVTQRNPVSSGISTTKDHDQGKSSPALSTISVKRSQSSSSLKSVTPSASSGIAAKPDLGKIFVSGGRPMTFSVHPESFATEFCLKSGGGMILPLEYASTIIFMRHKTQPHCTEEEEDILDGVELRGNWQVVLSSTWIENCLKYQSLVPEEEYRITKLPREPSFVCITHGHDSKQAPQQPQEVTYPTREDEDDNEDDDNDGESVIFVSDNKPALATRPSPVEPATRPQRTGNPDRRTSSTSSDKVSTSPILGTSLEREPKDTPAASSTHTRKEDHNPKVTPLRSAAAQAQEIDVLVTLLVEELKNWDPKEIPRTKFLNNLSVKHPERAWRKFFDRHRAKIGLKFRELKYTYPGKEGDLPDEDEVGEVDELMSEDEGSVWEP